MRVLVVENDPSVRHLIDRALTVQGHNVILASNAIEAWALLADFPGPIHIALIDLVLPVIPGLAMAGVLKEQYPEIRLIFMTSAVTMPEVEMAKRHGAVLEKPFPISHLLNVIALAES
jgi:DNA-binding response OmpR family regulator